jgi:DNA-binding beta-propeller fold protein YncE
VAVDPLTQRAFVSNYNDRLAIIDAAGNIGFVKGSGISGGYTAGYGIDVNAAAGLIYQATIDSGKLVIFHETSAVNDAQNGNTVYSPCLLPPPLAEGPRVFRMVAVDPVTGQVFVTSPPDSNKGQTDSKVYVMNQTALLNLVGTPSASACSGLSQAQQDGLWIATVTLPGAIIGGQEGLAVNSLTKRVYISDAPANKLFVLDGTPGNIKHLATIDNVGNNPYGVTVDEQTNKVYIANAHDKNAANGTVSVIDGNTNTVIKVINLTP